MFWRQRAPSLHQTSPLDDLLLSEASDYRCPYLKAKRPGIYRPVEWPAATAATSTLRRPVARYAADKSLSTRWCIYLNRQHQSHAAFGVDNAAASSIAASNGISRGLIAHDILTSINRNGLTRRSYGHWRAEFTLLRDLNVNDGRRRDINRPELMHAFVMRPTCISCRAQASDEKPHSSALLQWPRPAAIISSASRPK